MAVVVEVALIAVVGVSGVASRGAFATGPDP